MRKSASQRRATSNRKTPISGRRTPISDRYSVADYSALEAEVQHLREELATERQTNDADMEAFREMEVSRAHYADLYDFAPVGFATLDRAGIVRDINLTGAYLLGHDRAGLLGLPVLPLVAKPDRAKWLKHLASLRLQPHAMV